MDAVSTTFGGHGGAAARDRRLAGAAFVLVALACFAGLDTTTKAISVLPVAVVMWARYTVQAVMTGATLLPRRGLALARTRHPGLQVLRGVLLLSTSVFGYLSLRRLPVGELTAIIMMTPLVMTLVAARVGHERVSLPRKLLIAACFGGVLLVVRPGGATFSGAALLPLAALATNVGFHLATSRLARVDDVGTMQLWTGCTGAVLATLALPFVDLPSAGWGTWALLALVCVLSTLGHGLLIVGYSEAGIAMLTPLLYVQIAFATLFGWAVFGHVPDAMALAGVAIIGIGGAACMALK